MVNGQLRIIDAAEADRRLAVLSGPPPPAADADRQCKGHGWQAMTREEALTLIDALSSKAGRLRRATRILRASLDDSKMVEQWGVASLVDAHLTRISLASADMHSFVKNAISKLRIDPHG
jgi:hypothetical protein